MKKIFFCAGIALSLLAVQSGFAQQPLGPETEIRGRVEQWAPGSSRIKVDGHAYRMSKGVQVIDKRAKVLPLHAVRAGSLVGVVISDDVVTHVVVNPGEEPTLDGSHQ